jgi:hypothetical protein
MPNPLEMGGPPEAPNIQPSQGNALQGGPPASPQGAAQGQQAPPAPSHVQTVAALRHFDAIKQELDGLWTNPALGKSSIKDSIIDGTTKLVSERIISPAAAVMQLGKVPDAPLEQRKWVQMLLQQTIQAANAVLDHHAAGSPGTLDWAQEGQQQAPNPDNHMQMMSSLHSQYQNGGR